MSQPTRLEDLPLSQTPLWSSLQQYYTEMGIEAWSDDGVPYQATNNPMMAQFYRDMIQKICQRVKFSGEPIVHLIELGAGSGQLAHYLLKTLKEQPLSQNGQPIAWRYLLTDISPATIEHLSEKEPFTSYPKELSFEVLDALKPQDFGPHCREFLSHSGPCIVLANYIYDSLPMDLYSHLKEKLHSVLVSGERSNFRLEKARHQEAPLLEYCSQEITQAPYSNELWNQTLTQHLKEVQGHVYFPLGAAQTFDHFHQQSQNSLLVFATADKAFTAPHQYDLYPSQPTFHCGSISMTVDFLLLKKLCQNRGGEGFHSDRKLHDIDYGIFFYHDPQKVFQKVKPELEHLLERFSYLDLMALYQPMIDEDSELSLEQMIQIGRLSLWDPIYFFELSDKINLALDQEDLTQDLSHALSQWLTRVMDQFYYLDPSQDIPFEVGRLFYRLGEMQKAIKAYRLSYELFPPEAQIYFNLGLCYQKLGDRRQASQYFHRAHLKDPQDESIQYWSEHSKGYRFSLPT